MWAIKILTGPQAGLIFPIREGKHTVGRSTTCDVKIASNSVSKEHATLLAVGDKLIISDLDSRNGTFVNGVKIQNTRLNPGDKLSLHDVLLDVMQMSDQISERANASAMGAAGVPAWAGNAAVRLQEQQNFAAQPQFDQQQFAPNEYGAQAQSQSLTQEERQPVAARDLLSNIQAYIENVAMPGVYAIAQSFPYRWSLGLLVLIYVFVVTALSIVPIVTTTKANIQNESVRRARSIARNVRDTNKKYILDHNDAAIDLRSAELEEGVTAVMIISAKDGTVIAPAAKRGEYVNKPFVNQARREDREFANYIDDSNLGVSVPIAAYNPDSGNQSAIAYAIVLYDVGSLAMTPKEELSLFVQTLAIALIAGAFLFFFLYKVVEHPIESAGLQLDDALREGRDDLKTDYHFPALERLLSNVNSALSRIGQQNSPGSGLGVVINRDHEAQNLVRMITMPALTVNAIDDRVIATNSAFDRLVGGGLNLVGQPLTSIPDISLQQNLTDLLPHLRGSVGEIAMGTIPFSGQPYEICGQVVMGASEPAYFVFTMGPAGGDS
jgi:hypothetical protein